jgi:hypothetical protein
MQANSSHLASFFTPSPTEDEFFQNYFAIMGLAEANHFHGLIQQAPPYLTEPFLDVVEFKRPSFISPPLQLHGNFSLNLLNPNQLDETIEQLSDATLKYFPSLLNEVLFFFVCFLFFEILYPSLTKEIHPIYLLNHLRFQMFKELPILLTHLGVRMNLSGTLINRI